MLCVQPGEQGVVPSIVLFGEFRYDLHVYTDLRPQGSPCWVLDHREREPLQFASISDTALAWSSVWPPWRRELRDPSAPAVSVSASSAAPASMICGLIPVDEEL